MSKLEETLLLHIKAMKLPMPVVEYKFHDTRRWRFDFAWPDSKLAVEVEGGTWGKSRHTTGKGFEADCLKYDEAMRLGWNIYRCSGDMVKNGRAIETIKLLLGV
jgi:hypothetical protein